MCLFSTFQRIACMLMVREPVDFSSTEEGGLKRFVLLVINVSREISVLIDGCNNKNVVTAKNFLQTLSHQILSCEFSLKVHKCFKVKKGTFHKYISTFTFHLWLISLINTGKTTFRLSCIRYATKKGNFSYWFRQQGICNVLVCLRLYQNHC